MDCLTHITTTATKDMSLFAIGRHEQCGLDLLSIIIGIVVKSARYTDIGGFNLLLVGKTHTHFHGNITHC
jgi:hypothetical protein